MHVLNKGLVVASLLCAGFLSHHQDAKKEPAGMAVPEPTAEHKWLAEDAGKWKATGKYQVGPGVWVPISGVQTNTMQQGGLWQIIDFKDDAGQFSGHGVAGYDPGRKKFMSLWVDNASAEFAPAEGTLSADKKTLTSEFTKTDASGKKVKVTETFLRKDSKTTLMEMFDTVDGKPVKTLEITYTRM